MTFGVFPCLCKPGAVINGHKTWLIDSNCPEHGDPPEDKKKKKK